MPENFPMPAKRQKGKRGAPTRRKLRKVRIQTNMQKELERKRRQSKTVSAPRGIEHILDEDRKERRG